MIHVGESSTLKISDEEFNTFLKVLNAMKNDGVALFLCAQQHLSMGGIDDAAEKADEWAEQCRTRLETIAISSTAYYIRIKQRQAEVLDNVGDQV